jgi:hypothetical protein
MEKLEPIIATGLGIKEGLETILNFLGSSTSSEYYEVLDTLTFLNCEMLGLVSDGRIIDTTKIIGEAVFNLSHLVIWGVILYYLFLSLFGYFFCKKVEIPWKIFIRTVVCGMMINASFFLCYFAVYLTENSTQYIIDACGGNTSFSYLEDKIDELDMEVNEEIEKLFSVEKLIKVAIRILLLLLNIVTGMRFIGIKLFVLFSPLIFALGCSNITEKAMLKFIKVFGKLLAYQVIAVVVLEIAFRIKFIDEAVLRILIMSVMVILIRFAKKI